MRASDLRADATVVRVVLQKTDLCCRRCGYGIVSRARPARCPMCGCDASWAERPGQGSRQATIPERAG
jgi:rubrerythrin